MRWHMQTPDVVVETVASFDQGKLVHYVDVLLGVSVRVGVYHGVFVEGDLSHERDFVVGEAEGNHGYYFEVAQGLFPFLR